MAPPIASAPARFPRATTGCTLLEGRWGDVNGDSISTPMGDGTVNIIDAQQIARYSVGLTAAARISTAVSVPPAITLVVVGPARKGVSVGGTVNLTAEPRDISGTPQTDCVTLTWASSDTAIARVGDNGAKTTGNSAREHQGLRQRAANRAVVHRCLRTHLASGGIWRFCSKMASYTASAGYPSRGDDLILLFPKVLASDPAL